MKTREKIFDGLKKAIREMEERNIGLTQPSWEAIILAAAYLEGRHNWIPVEEELPPASCGVISDPVLVFIGNNKGWSGYIREGFYNHAAKEWSYMNRGRTHKVTHWMPLPQPPRKEDDNE